MQTIINYDRLYDRKAFYKFFYCLLFMSDDDCINCNVQNLLIFKYIFTKCNFVLQLQFFSVLMFLFL